jgi:hypothetical protein
MKGSYFRVHDIHLVRLHLSTFAKRDSKLGRISNRRKVRTAPVRARTENLARFTEIFLSCCWFRAFCRRRGVNKHSPRALTSCEKIRLIVRAGPVWPPAATTDGLAKQIAQFPRMHLERSREPAGFCSGRPHRVARTDEINFFTRSEGAVLTFSQVLMGFRNTTASAPKKRHDTRL